MKRFPLSVALSAVMLVGVTACGGDSGGGGSSSAGASSENVSIKAPADGASINAPFQLTVTSNEDLGTTESGKHHIHLYFDGDDSKYEVVEAADRQIKSDSPALKGLSPGEHTLNVSLRNADHSPAGAEDEIKVMVGGSGQPAPSESASSSDDSSGGYSYDY